MNGTFAVERATAVQGNHLDVLTTELVYESRHNTRCMYYKLVRYENIDLVTNRGVWNN